MVLKVVEIFRSIQGEGLYIGRPSVFVRFAGCNLRCKWCDTKYAWAGGHDITVDELYRIVTAQGFEEDALVLTGGEPLLQDHGELTEFLNKTDFFPMMVETNGTIKPSDGLLEVVDVWSISPKLRNSGVPDAVKIDVLSLIHI